MKITSHFFIFLISLLNFSCSHQKQIKSGNLILEVNEQLQTKVTNLAPNTKPLMNDFSSSEYLVCDKFDAKLFQLESSEKKRFSDQKGEGERTILTGIYKQDGYSIKKILEITVYDSFPGMAFLNLKYVNEGSENITVTKWINGSYKILSQGDSPAFWSFQGGSSKKRQDWILQIDSSISRQNFLGMVASDCGGGTPITDIWRKDAGIAIGSAEIIPRYLSLPVKKEAKDSCVEINIEREFLSPLKIESGDTLITYSTFVSVHTGDYFSTFQEYSKFMQASGIKLAPVQPDAYQAVWCSWGYERKFTLDEIIGTLPKIKELGIKWVDIDDGFQIGVGDWHVDRSIFKGGDAEMRSLVDSIHAMGLKAKLWWAPFAIDTGSSYLAENPDVLVLNQNLKPQIIPWWKSYYMSPQYYKTIEKTKEAIELFLKDWDYDGLKTDGGYMNCVTPDYEPSHQLEYPEKSYEELPEFFKMLYNTAISIKPNAVVQVCPCGLNVTFFIMPYMNQTVSSDPKNSWQIRLRAKSYKALLGKVAYYGDHIEMSDGADDFASQVGVGAVLGTKFTWPKDNPYSELGDFLLTPEREVIWKKWIGIFNQKMLPEGDYRGELYDIGYDKPETHVIQKTDTMYYSFYGKNWNGDIEIRGLSDKTYKVSDYVNNIDYGKVKGPNSRLNVKFEKYLLLEFIPE